MSEPDDAGRTPDAPGAAQPGPDPIAPPEGWSWGSQTPDQLGYGGPGAPAGQGPSGQPQYGQPQYGQPQYGQPQYGQPQYGQPQYGQPQYGQGQYGAPQPLVTAPRPGVIPLRPIGLGEVFDGSFRAIRANPRVMFGFAAIVVSISVVIQLVIQWYAFGSFGDLMLDPAMQDADAALDGLSSVLLGVGVGAIISMLATTILTGILIVSVSRSVIGENLRVGQVWAHARPQIWRLILLTFLVGIIIILVPTLWFAGAVALFGVGADGAALTMVLAGIPASVVWFAWVIVRTLLTTPALMLERLTVVGGLKRGWLLSRGVYWRLFGIYLLTIIIVYFVSSILSAPASMATVFLGPAAFTSPLGLALTGISSLLAAVVTTPFTAAVVALLYVDTRMRREGLDVQLARAAEAVAENPDGSRG